MLQSFRELYDALAELLADKENRIDLKTCGSSVHFLFESTLNSLLNQSSTDCALLVKADALIDYCNESIMCYHFKDVPLHWRRMLMDAGLLKTLIQLHSLSNIETGNFKALETQVQKTMMDLDTCAIVSGAPGVDRKCATNVILEHLQSWLTNGRNRNGMRRTLSKANRLLLPRIDCPIKKLAEPPSFEWFLQHCNSERPTPFIISKGLIDHWPAFNEHPWTSIDYLLSIASDRIVPVELGSQYTDTNWSQKMIRFSDFVEQHIVQQSDTTAYLAQHDLFYQIPQLERDIIVPDYCYIKPNLNDLYTSHTDDVIKNAWFGPKNTVSPLHHDPYHNLLCQVVGSKYIKLISPEQSSYVYPRDGLMNNTSQVDVEHPDTHLYPLFDRVQYVECVLEEGQVLYVPPKWWHFVKSLDISFSVSLWF
ncbi:uncharacterized protein B0P05DRAFT_557486 [Gilbertella persicaria]|nr:uncharacterized protein B0P05DRAFT_557486 [Gilbertella persicaria]KAI8061550.1 hypothetical protein B0P05DRAFT_557486 [Gilbertella persicaria]